MVLITNQISREDWNISWKISFQEQEGGSQWFETMFTEWGLLRISRQGPRRNRGQLKQPAFVVEVRRQLRKRRTSVGPPS